MKTTLNLPDDLMRALKSRAAEQNRTLTDVISELLAHGLSVQGERPAVRNRVNLPLITGGHPAPPGEELTPERVAQILLDQEVEQHLAQVRGDRPSDSNQ